MRCPFCGTHDCGTVIDTMYRRSQACVRRQKKSGGPSGQTESVASEHETHHVAQRPATTDGGGQPHPPAARPTYSGDAA